MKTSNLAKILPLLIFVDDNTLTEVIPRATLIRDKLAEGGKGAEELKALLLKAIDIAVEELPSIRKELEAV